MSVFLVLALVSQLVLWCNCMALGSALGGILAFLPLCAGLPSYCDYYYYYYYYYYCRLKYTASVKTLPPLFQRQTLDKFGTLT